MSIQPQNLLNLTQAAKAAGITRKTLYLHIEKGLVSVTRHHGKRFVDVSELIRHYGSVSLPVVKVNDVTQSQSMQDSDAISVLNEQIKELKCLIGQQQYVLQDLNELARLKDETDLLREQCKNAFTALENVKSELDAERRKGFWARLFNRR